MLVTALITCHSRELALICLRSLVRHAPTIQRVTVSTHTSCRWMPPELASHGQLHVLQPPGGAANHAAALAHARRMYRAKLRQSDIVLLLDDDVVILDDDFGMFLLGAFDGNTGAWGAAGIRDPLHPSCLAFRRELFDRVTTFASALPKHDTTGLAQAEIQAWGYRLEAVPRVVASAGWEDFTLGPPVGNVGADEILWSHLGGGVIHAPVSPLRRVWRHLKAAGGSAAARDLIRKARMREQWIETYG